MANTFNWVQQEKQRNATSAEIALKKACDLEAKRVRKGYRWVKINNKTSILVPCDKDGKPTEEGRMKIKKYTNNSFNNS